MSREELYKVIEDAIRKMDNDDLVALYNEYENSGGDDHIYYNNDAELDMFFEGDSPSEVIGTLGDYHTYDKYFKVNGYGYIDSFSGLLSDKSPIYPPEIAEYIVDNDDELYNDEIRDILDSADDDFDESLRRGRRCQQLKEYIDNSEDINFLENIFEKLRYHSKNLNKTQYYLFSVAYDSFQEFRNGNGTEKDIFKKCREFAEYCQTHNKNLTKMQDGLVDDILSNT